MYGHVLHIIEHWFSRLPSFLTVPGPAAPPSSKLIACGLLYSWQSSSWSWISLDWHSNPTRQGGRCHKWRDWGSERLAWELDNVAARCRTDTNARGCGGDCDGRPGWVVAQHWRFLHLFNRSLSGGPGEGDSPLCPAQLREETGLILGHSGRWCFGARETVSPQPQGGGEGSLKDAFFLGGTGCF